MVVMLWIVAVLLILAGVAGAVLPGLPGAPLVFLGLLLAARIDGFTRVGGLTIAVLAVLTVLSFGIDMAAVALGAKKVNASREALIGAVLGMSVGLFAGFGGLVLGPFIGAALGEFIARRDLRRAGQVGLATWVGMVLGTAFKLGLALLMVGLFITAYLWKS